MFKNYFRTAFRTLLRNRIYSSINVVGLSLGLACAMLIILYVEDEISYDRFHKNVSHIYRVNRKIIRDNGNIDYSGYTGLFQGPKFAAGIPEIQAFVRFKNGQKDMKNGTEIHLQEVFYTDSNFFSVFSFPLLKGNPKIALREPNSVVITEEVAKKQFGTTDVLGKTLLLKNDSTFVPYAITGVAKKCPQNSSIKFQVLLPLRTSQQDERQNENWFNFFLNTFVVLAPRADVKSVETKLKKVFETDAAESIKMIQQTYGKKDLGFSYFLQPLSEIHLAKNVAEAGLSDASNPVYSYVLSGIAVFILLIACINFINLTVARSLKRAKEIGVRKVIGGSRKQLIVQFLGESFILCLGAFILAILLTQYALPIFNQLSNKALALSYLLDAKLIAGYIGLFTFTSLLAGFYPAFVLSNFNPVQTLYNRFNLTGKDHLQKSLIILQFALASFLIIATLTIFSQFNFLINKKLGYDDSNLVSTDINSWGIQRSEAKLIKEELTKNPNIIGVAFKNGGSWSQSAKVNGEAQLQFIGETVDESYIPLLRIPVIQGRNFSKEFPSDSSHSVLVNETFVKNAGWKNPVGQEINFWESNGKKYTVIGVVKDYHYESLTRKIEPQLFATDPNISFGKTFIKIKPGNETATLGFIEKVFKKIFPLSPYSYVFMDQENQKNYEIEARWKRILLFGAIFTIFISCIGLFGLSVLAAEKRTKEIGIRKVLGASISSVITTLSKGFLKLVIIALFIAIPLAWLATNKWLENYPYRITLSWSMFIEAALLVIFIALATVSFQSIKAAMANPVKSLRTE